MAQGQGNLHRWHSSWFSTWEPDCSKVNITKLRKDEPKPPPKSGRSYKVDRRQVPGSLFCSNLRIIVMMDQGPQIGASHAGPQIGASHAALINASAAREYFQDMGLTLSHTVPMVFCVKASPLVFLFFRLAGRPAALFLAARSLRRSPRRMASQDRKIPAEPRTLWNNRDQNPKYGHKSPLKPSHV